MKKNIIILSLAALSLTGCGVMKNYDREEVAQPIDIETLYGDALSGDSLGLGDLQWREFFTDPHLQRLIEQGLTSNPDMQIAAQRVVASQAALRTAKLSFYPSFAFNPSYSLNAPFNSSSSSSYSRSSSSTSTRSSSYSSGSSGGYSRGSSGGGSYGGGSRGGSSGGRR